MSVMQPVVRHDYGAELRDLLATRPKPYVSRAAALLRNAAPVAPAASGRLVIRDEITSATALAFARSVRDTKADEIEVLIDCTGGEVDASFDMALSLQRFKGRTTALLLKADSAALFVALGVDRRIAARDGIARLHNVTAELAGDQSVNAPELEGAADDLRSYERNISRLLENATGTPAHKWQGWIDAKTTMDAEAMLKHGLVERISRWPKAALLAGKAP